MSPGVGPLSSLSACLSAGATDGVEGTGEIKKRDSPSAARLVQVRVGPVEQIEVAPSTSTFSWYPDCSGSCVWWTWGLRTWSSSRSRVFIMCDVSATGLKSPGSLGCFFSGTGMRHEVFQNTGTLPWVQAQVEDMLEWLPQFSRTGFKHPWTHSVRACCFPWTKPPQLSVHLILGDGSGEGG